MMIRWGGIGEVKMGSKEYIKVLQQTIYEDFSSNLRIEELELLDDVAPPKGLMETRKGLLQLRQKVKRVLTKYIEEMDGI
jgi:hypothetical protein